MIVAHVNRDWFSGVSSEASASDAVDASLSAASTVGAVSPEEEEEEDVAPSIGPESASGGTEFPTILSPTHALTTIPKRTPPDTVASQMRIMRAG